MGAVMLTGEGGGGSVLSLATFVLIVISSLFEVFGFRAGTPERQRIYEALRELALLTDDPAPATASALRQSDQLIDQLTTGSHLPRGLGAEAPAPTTARRRVRS